MALTTNPKSPNTLVIASLLLLAIHADSYRENATVDQSDEKNEPNIPATTFNVSFDDFESLDFEKIHNDTYDEPYIMASNRWSYSNESLDLPGPTVETVDAAQHCVPVKQCTGKCAGRTVDYFNQCQCDDLCWFYGDCCFDYYAGCLNVTIFDGDDTILRSLLVNVGSYSQLLHLYDAYRWRRLSSCLQIKERTFQAVSACGADPDIGSRFERLHENLNRRSLNHVNIFQGISKSDIMGRCQQLNSSQNQYTLDRIPVSLNTSYTMVYFYNVFCAICNGVDPADVTLMEYTIECGSTQMLNDTWANVQAALGQGCQTFMQFPGDMRKCSDIRQPYNNSVFDFSSLVHTLDQALLQRLYRNYTKPSTKNTGHGLKKERGGPPRSKQRDRARFTRGNITENGGDAVRCNSLVPINARLCHMYSYPQVIAKHDLVFKNPHCQLCLANRAAQEAGGHILAAYMCTKKTCLCQKGNKKHNMRLMNVFTIIPPQFPKSIEEMPYKSIPSFRLLYNFNSRDTTIRVHANVITIEIKSCPANQVYVPYYQRCSAITCTRGTHLVGQKCVRPEGCLAPGPCHQNYTASLDTDDVLFPSSANTVMVKLRLWYALDESVHLTEKGKDETPSQAEMWYRETDDSSHNISLSTNKRFSDDSLDRPTIMMEDGVQKAGGNNSMNTSDAQKKIRERSSAPRLTPYVDREVILANIITPDRMRAQWAAHKVKTGEYNKTDLLIKFMRRARHTLTSHVRHLVNHTVEMFEAGVCSQEPTYASGVSDSCIYLTLNCDGNVTHDNLTFLLTDSAAVSSLVNAAHEYNFVLRHITLANDLADIERNVGQTLEPDRDVTDDAPQRHCRDGAVLHSELKPVSYNETGLFYYVEFADGVYPLSGFLYSFVIDVNVTARAARLAMANVSWCREDSLRFECNYTTVLFNTSHYIRYGTSIVVTKHGELIKEFLSQFSERKRKAVKVGEFVSLFKQQYGMNDTAIYESGEYRLEDDHVFVCSDFESSFEVRNESTVSRLYSYMPKSDLEQLTTLIALCVSMTCLVAVLVVYSLVPELRNIPGQIVMSMSSALLLAQVLFLCCSYPQGLACEVYASVHHAAWLASFAWLAAMSVHLTFILHSKSHGSLQSSAYIFPTISVLCWGLPLLLAGCCFTLDKTGAVPVEYGKNGFCWIGNAQSMLFAFGVPLFLLLAVTSVCAVFVVRAIRNSSDFRNKNTTTHKGVRTHLLLCINLALLMGFNWIFYFVAVAVEASSMWAVFILTNGSQGLYIFLCYVARKSVLAKLCKRLNVCQSSSENYGRTVGSQPATRVMTLTTTLSKDVALSVVGSRQGTPSPSPLPSPKLNYHALKM